MRFDLNLRSAIREQVELVAEKMKAWEEAPRIAEDEKGHLRQNVEFFAHNTRRAGLRLAGVDGSGDFPALSYGDSFVYVTVAQSTTYESDAVSGLREVGPAAEPLVKIAWIPEEQAARHAELDRAFAELAGTPIAEVIERSDYRWLKGRATRRSHTVEELNVGLIRPHAADAGNIGLQLRATAELGAARRVLDSAEQLDYLLIDGTLSLPLGEQKGNSLFYEHLKRLCCVEAKARRTGFLALSKSHGLPGMELIEELAREKGALERGQVAEHWYLRLPAPGIDRWQFSLAEGRRLPPLGTITYLVRFHRNTPVMRLDMDVEYWQSRVRGASEEETGKAEQHLFADLDYAGHDQRSYGYPYPLKAAHDRASLTDAERTALRKQIIDAAVKAGMKRALFRDAAQATGHR
jgi:hypothetical protein